MKTIETKRLIALLESELAIGNETISYKGTLMAEEDNSILLSTEGQM